MGNIIWEDLPTSNGVDLDRESVFTLSSDISDMEMFGEKDSITMAVVESGKVHLYHSQTGVVEAVAWGRTPRDEHGHADVVVDIPLITCDHLRVLWLAGVITGDYPTPRLQR